MMNVLSPLSLTKITKNETQKEWNCEGVDSFDDSKDSKDSEDSLKN